MASKALEKKRAKEAAELAVEVEEVEFKKPERTLLTLVELNRIAKEGAAARRKLAEEK